MGNPKKHIAIIGLGLMGGSLGLALRKISSQDQIIGFSRKSRTIRQARQRKAIHWGGTDLRKIASSADFIILCAPVETFPTLLTKIDKFARRGTLVTDVGSTKEKILSWTNRKRFRNIHFVGSHPMAGGHEKGIQAARGNLYHHSLCFVAKGKRTSALALKKVVQFWNKEKQSIGEIRISRK